MTTDGSVPTKASDFIPTDYKVLYTSRNSEASIGSYTRADGGTTAVLTRQATATLGLVFEPVKPWKTLPTLRLKGRTGKELVLPPDHFTTLDFSSDAPTQTITHETNLDRGRLRKNTHLPLFGSQRKVTFGDLGACESTIVTFHGEGESAKSLKDEWEATNQMPSDYKITIETLYPNADLQGLYEYLAETGASTSIDHKASDSIASSDDYHAHGDKSSGASNVPQPTAEPLPQRESSEKVVTTTFVPTI
ncbi:hypothetical protein IAT40_004748 [Kwoniella sp. CBS 6097]